MLFAFLSPATTKPSFLNLKKSNPKTSNLNSKVTFNVGSAVN